MESRYNFNAISTESERRTIDRARDQPEALPRKRFLSLTIFSPFSPSSSLFHPFPLLPPSPISSPFLPAARERSIFLHRSSTLSSLTVSIIFFVLSGVLPPFRRWPFATNLDCSASLSGILLGFVLAVRFNDATIQPRCLCRRQKHTPPLFTVDPVTEHNKAIHPALVSAYLSCSAGFFRGRSR